MFSTKAKQQKALDAVLAARRIKAKGGTYKKVDPNKDPRRKK